MRREKLNMDKQIITRKIKNFLIAERGMDMVGVCPRFLIQTLCSSM